MSTAQCRYPYLSSMSETPGKGTNRRISGVPCNPYWDLNDADNVPYLPANLTKYFMFSCSLLQLRFYHVPLDNISPLFMVERRSPTTFLRARPILLSWSETPTQRREMNQPSRKMLGAESASTLPNSTYGGRKAMLSALLATISSSPFLTPTFPCLCSV